MTAEYRKEIIERLERIANHAVHTVGERPFVMSLDDGIAVHKAIEALERSRWIPIEENKPSKGKRVLFYLEKPCTYENPNGMYETLDWWVQEGTYDGKERGYYLYRAPDIGIGISEDYIKAWMPLPEPYKAESEE